MADRVQRQPPHALRRGITQRSRDPAMGDFVKDNGDDQCRDQRQGAIKRFDHGT